MISINKIKFINSLKEKKYRLLHKLFVIEGEKIVKDILIYNPLKVDQLFATESWLNKNETLEAFKKFSKVNIVSIKEIGKISSFKSTPDVLAILYIDQNDIDENEIAKSLSLVLDTIQDPGNMGNIIRIADWFGIRNIICSPNCVDCYNPKVVQASMGAIIRVAVHYIALDTFLRKMSTVQCYNIYGTFLDGADIYSASLEAQGAIVMGNESQGISDNLMSYINKKIFISSYNHRSKTIDSLNVAAATAIVCSEFRRRLL